MKRPSFLASHLRGLNRSIASERRRTFRLLGIAYAVLLFSSGWIACAEYRAKTRFPHLYHYQGAKTRPAPLHGSGNHAAGDRQVVAGEHEAFVGEPESRIEQKLSFTF